MVIFGFDLATLFKAPKVTMEPEIPEPQEPMPGEYLEVDTNAQCSVNLDEPSYSPSPVPAVDNMHQKMYELSIASPISTDLDPIITDVGGSENFQGGSENLG